MTKIELIFVSIEIFIEVLFTYSFLQNFLSLKTTSKFKQTDKKPFLWFLWFLL